MTQRRILLGTIGRPHGVRGLLHVTSYTDAPADLAAYGPLSDGAGRRLSLVWRGDGIAAVTLLTDAGPVPVRDRDAAARLTNTRLFIDRDRLPPPAEADEFYLADLIGLPVQDMAGTPLGRVAGLHDYGGGTSLEVARSDAPPLLLPFTRACVPVIDLDQGLLRVDPPAEVAGEAPPDKTAGLRASGGADQDHAA